MSKIRRPQQGRVLRDALLANAPEDVIIGRISNGILALCSNARRLLDEAKLLCQHGHFATGHFLLATADEEIAKVYILLDIVRLDFAKHGAHLKRLCDAFYSHIAKAAYMNTVRFSGLRDMQRAKEFFEAQRIEYYEAPEESGEPNMPSLALAVREWNLYVDYSDWDEAWQVPSDSYARDILADSAATDEIEDSLLRLERTRDSHLFSANCLRILHEEFSKRFISVSTSNEEIENACRRVLLKVEKMGVTLPEESDNALLEWPLYSFFAS